MSLAELRNYFLEAADVPSRHLVARLELDPRRGARRIAELALRRRRAADRERRRLSAMLSLERRYWAQGLHWVAGVDEVGVGPLAGPVVAAAVVFRPGSRLAGMRDSKQLLPAERREIAREIRKNAAAISIGEASVAEIDHLNPYHASLLAMRRAVEGLDQPPQRLLVDARIIPQVDIPQDSVIRGDQKHFSIAAASIIAKEWRDDLMCALDRLFPGYGFARHKGYSTPQHQAAIRRLGPCEHHRSSYPVIQELAGNCSDSFYHLKSLLRSLQSRDDLVAWKRLLLRARDLAPSEVRKLRLLLDRQTRSLPRPSQMSLL